MSGVLVVSHPAVLPVNQLVYAELARRGWPIELVVPARWHHDFGPIAPEPVPELAGHFHRIPVLLSGKPQRHTYVVRPSTLLRRFRPGAVFIEAETFSVAALQWAVAAHRQGVPFGVQAAENLDRQLPAPVRAWSQWIVHHSAFVAARSESAARRTAAQGATGDVRVVPHAVPPWPATERAARTDGSFVIGFAGRLVAQKGLDVLVDAVRRLSGDVTLAIAGDGPLRDWLQNADLCGARLHLDTQIDHSAMAGAYAGMDVLVLPSRTTPVAAEQFGRVLVEALQCGVPVVGSDSGEIPWVIGQTGGGRIVPEGDAVALAATLADLRSAPDTRASLAETGRRAVDRLFSVRAVADQFATLLSEPLSHLLVSNVAHDGHVPGGMERT
jgi:glycosyltransferase involved in cell wall biosynthesis